MEFLQTYTLDQMVGTAVAIAVLAAGIVSIGYALWGALLLVVSGWDDKKVKDAINHIRYSAVGIILLVLILIIAPIFFNLLGLPISKQFQPSTVLENMSKLSDRIFKAGGSNSYSDARIIDTTTDNLSSGWSDI